ncbi:MAG: SRPBCC family protein [Haloarculaceae archaeon]
MQRVSVSRTVDADPDEIRAAMDDLAAFMRAAKFDEVRVEGDRLELANRVGLFEIELELAVIETDAALAYEQREGIFESMDTEYTIDERDGRTEVTATTEFELLDLPVLGEMIDATIIKRQRRKELTAQFDWLEETLG